MSSPFRVAACAVLLGALHASAGARAWPVEVLRPVGALPAYVATQLIDPAAIVTTRTGDRLILDRRAHTVFVVKAAGGDARRLLEVGYEPGRLLQPLGLALSDDDIFAVIDAPNGVPRIQYFGTDGLRVGGFFLPSSAALGRRVVEDGVIRSLTSVAFTGRTFLVNEPTWGSVMTELDNMGQVLRQIGSLRRTGAESDKPLNESLNAGLPLVDPTGGYYFVFQTGLPLFRKYGRDGTLLFERHIEGIEIDRQVLALPNTWPPRRAGVAPIASSLVRTAAVDRDGRLWVSLEGPYTYVYDPSGEKVRVVQFVGTSAIAATHLSFDRRGRVMVTPDGYEFEVSPATSGTTPAGR